jgi:hypothetical protein
MTDGTIGTITLSDDEARTYRNFKVAARRRGFTLEPWQFDGRRGRVVLFMLGDKTVPENVIG